MSAPIESSESSEDLDPESEDFDSLRALYSEKAAPPCPNVRVYDNVEQYENYIKSAQQGTLRLRLQHAGRGKRAAATQEALAGSGASAVSAPAGRGAGPSSGAAGPSSGATGPSSGTAGPSSGIAAMSSGRGGASGDSAMTAGPSGEEGGNRFIIPGRRFTERQAPVAVQRKTQRSVLTRMKAAMPGPSGRLKWYMDHRVKVKVYIRNYGRVRGVCIGYIVAFDKHWNLCLEDVDEIYQKKVRRKSVFLGDADRVPVSEDWPAGDAGVPSAGQWPGQRARPSQATDPRQRTSAARARDDRSWSPDRPRDHPRDRSSRPSDRPSGRSSSAGRYSDRDPDRTSDRASGRDSSRTSTRISRQAAEEDPEVARLTARMALLEPPRSRRSQRRPVFETARRHVRQLFVRGDNVVLVAVEQEGGGEQGGSGDEIQEVPVEGGSDQIQKKPVDTG